MKQLIRLFLGVTALATLCYVFLLLSSHPPSPHQHQHQHHHHHPGVARVHAVSGLPFRSLDKKSVESLHDNGAWNNKPETDVLHHLHDLRYTNNSSDRSNKDTDNTISNRDDDNNNNNNHNPDKYPTATTTTSNSTNGFLVYVCDSRRSCGGWGDRQRGLVGVFLLALVTRRRFVLVMTTPCDVIQHYEPPSPPRGGAAGWRVDPEVLRAAALISNVSVDDMGSRLGLTTRLGGGLDFNQLYPQNVVFIRTNGEYWLGLRKSKLYKSSLPAWALKSRAVYFAEGWSRLMTPSRPLQARLDAVLARMHFRNRTRPLVCAHVRVGQSGTLKRDTAVRCNISTLPVLWTFLQRWVDNGSDVFLATDSYAARNLTRHHFGARMLDTGEAIVHVDQGGRGRGRGSGAGDAACFGFQSALLDQLVLSRCDVLVTSHSIFGQRAAYLRGKSDNLYSFLKGKIRQYGL